MSEIARRQLLAFFGAAAAAQATPALLRPLRSAAGLAEAAWAGAFCVPLSGPDARQICPVAIGPVRCEMTGPTFVGDTLIISVQHPGEDTPIGTGLPDLRSIEMLNLNGATFSQDRTVPRGSNWPNNVEGALLGPPRPATIGITRNRKKEDRRSPHLGALRTPAVTGVRRGLVGA